VSAPTPDATATAGRWLPVVRARLAATRPIDPLERRANALAAMTRTHHRITEGTNA